MGDLLLASKRSCSSRSRLILPSVQQPPKGDQNIDRSVVREAFMLHFIADFWYWVVRQHRHLACNAAIDLLRIATGEGQFSTANQPAPLRVLDSVELASVVLLEVRLSPTPTMVPFSSDTINTSHRPCNLDGGLGKICICESESSDINS